jgi:hypothetical protein
MQTFSMHRVVSVVDRTWENIYPTFSSSLGSTLLLIEKATHDPLYLWDIRPLASIIIIIFYLLVLYLLALSNTPENPFASIYSESLFKTACQHLLLLIGFDTLIYRKYYDTPPILVGHQQAYPCHRWRGSHQSHGSNAQLPHGGRQLTWGNHDNVHGWSTRV